MSSILNALKKLESEAPARNEDAAPSLHRAMNVRRTLHNRFQKERLIRGLLLALAGVLVLAVGLGLYVNRRRLPIIKRIYPGGEVARSVAPPPDRMARADSPPQTEPDPEPPPKAVDAQPASDAVRQPQPEPERLAAVSEPPVRERSIQRTPTPRKPPAPPKNRPVRRPVRAAAPEPITPTMAPAKPDIPRSRPAPPEKPRTVPTPKPPASSSPPSPKRTPATGVKIADLAVRTAPPPEPAPATTPPKAPNQAAAGVPANFANVIQRSDPRFHIQALVWSPAPEGRMAMVNGNIVKTGGLVDGARIIHIGETFLIFQENGNRWRHPFRVK